MSEFPKGKIVPTSKSDARLYIAKAREFGAAARDQLGASQWDAAMLSAIHAAISAADAVTVAIGGQRSTDPDHHRAADLLEHVARRSEGVTSRARQLRALIKKKNLVEYEARRGTAAEASDAVERASRLVQWAEGIVEGGLTER